MQRLINQHSKLSVKFTAKLFLVISIMEGNRPVCEKNRIIFAINCKYNPVFQFETKFFLASSQFL